MIKHATAGAFVFCRFPGEWRLGLVEHPRMGVLACPGGHVGGLRDCGRGCLREVEEETGLRGCGWWNAVAIAARRVPGHAQPDPAAGWITEIEVPADNHLAEPHVHVDHMWVALAMTRLPAGPAAHPFGWYTARRQPRCRCSRIPAW